MHVGVVQMMNRSDSCLGSSDPLTRFYALGNDSAVDILYTDHSSPLGRRHHHVLHSKHARAGYSSAFEDVVAGDYPNKQKNYLSAW